MTSSPQAPRALVPANLLEESRDGYSSKATIAGRHSLVEHFSINASGNWTSAFNVPSNMRAVITAWGVDWDTAFGALVSLQLEVTIAGNAYAGTSDTAAGSFVRQGQLFQGAAAAHPDVVPNLLPDGSLLVTSEGTDANPMWRINATTLTSPDVVSVAVWYHLIHADTLGCTTFP